ncbi:ribonuclease T2-like protein, partial [Sphaerosporella brunnea]
KACSLTTLSCHNTTAVADTCCFNAPGGQLLQTQFWDYDAATGPADSWTIPGLWPDNCDGTYQANCDSCTGSVALLTSAGETELLQVTCRRTGKPTPGWNASFREYEWAKHGTCISTLDPSCYASYTQGRG